MTDPNNSSPPWPRIPAGPAAYVLAIGTLTVRFNSLEKTLLDLLDHYTGAPQAVTTLLFQKTSDSERTQWLEQVAFSREEDERVRDALAFFRAAYLTCSQNRGLLIHSQVLADWDGDVLTAKRKRDGSAVVRAFTIRTAQRVADETLRCGRYGQLLLGFILRKSLDADAAARVGLHLTQPSSLPKKFRQLKNLGADTPRNPNMP